MSECAQRTEAGPPPICSGARAVHEDDRRLRTRYLKNPGDRGTDADRVLQNCCWLESHRRFSCDSVFNFGIGPAPLGDLVSELLGLARKRNLLGQPVFEMPILEDRALSLALLRSVVGQRARRVNYRSVVRPRQLLGPVEGNLLAPYEYCLDVLVILQDTYILQRITVHENQVTEHARFQCPDLPLEPHRA